jgi:hypothetical protein
MYAGSGLRTHILKKMVPPYGDQSAKSPSSLELLSCIIRGVVIKEDPQAEEKLQKTKILKGKLHTCVMRKPVAYDGVYSTAVVCYP